jgi:hypothetical protein
MNFRFWFRVLGCVFLGLAAFNFQGRRWLIWGWAGLLLIALAELPLP